MTQPLPPEHPESLRYQYPDPIDLPIREPDSDEMRYFREEFERGRLQRVMPISPAAYLVRVRPTSEVAVWALTTGVIGLLAGWCMLGIPCLAAVVLGHVGLAQTKDEIRSGRGMAVAGLVLGYVSLIPAMLFMLWVWTPA